MLTDADKASWAKDVSHAERPAVVFFYAPWCRNCKAVRPKLQRMEKKYADDVDFYQVNFKVEEELCYQERVVNFPTVHFYFPRIGLVASDVLTASTADKKLTAQLDGLLFRKAQYERVETAAISPLVQYTELVGALQGLAEFTESKEADQKGFASLVDPQKESARLRARVEGDRVRLTELDELFRSLDADGDGELELGRTGGGVDAAVAALHPQDTPVTGRLLERIESCLAAGGDAQNRILASLGRAMRVDRLSFLSLMIDKSVRDFADGKQALLPAFEVLDHRGKGAVSKDELIETIDHFCTARPGTNGCDVDERSLRLTEVFEAFCSSEQQLDHEGFVRMVSGRVGTFGELDLADPLSGVVQPSKLAYKPEQDELMGERECFGAAVTAEGDDDYACDAWHYGEDPTKEKKNLLGADLEKVASLREAGERARAEREKKEAEMAAYLARMPR